MTCVIATEEFLGSAGIRLIPAPAKGRLSDMGISGKRGVRAPFATPLPFDKKRIIIKRFFRAKACS